MTDPSYLLVDPDREPGRALRLRDEAPLGRVALVVSRAAADRLVSSHTFAHRVEARDTAIGGEVFSADLPDIMPDQLSHLDDSGVARVGTEAKPGTVLVGKLTPKAGPDQTDTNSQIDGLFGVDSNVRDTSLRCAPDRRGVVTRAELTPAVGKKQPAAVELDLHHERPLRIGDVLCLADGRAGVVAEIVDTLEEGVDVLWPGASGRRRVNKVRCAEDDLEARSIGPYSLVTQQPLGGKVSFGGQRIQSAELDALIARGGRHLAHELLTAKSDDVDGRVRLYESIVKGRPELHTTVPEATRVLEAELVALGFDVDFEQETVAITLLDEAQIRARSHGGVEKPETINYRTFKPENRGLFCAQTFGPVRSYECLCGRHRGLRFRGTTCEECGVEVIDSRARRSRFGHIDLCMPILHPLGIAPAALLLAMTVAELDEVLSHRKTLEGAESESLEQSGAVAVRAALAALDLRAIAEGDSERAQLARTFLAGGHEPAALFFEVWPVLPPDLRPLVPLDGGRFATSDLNDLYRRLINRNNRLKRLLELSAPDVILRNEHHMLAEAIGALVANGAFGKRLTGPDKRPLKSILEMVSTPRGRFAVNLMQKRVDYSGCASLVPQPDLAPERVRVPRDFARELFKPFVYCALEARGLVATIKSAKRLVESRDAQAEEALERVVADRPLLLFGFGASPPAPLALEIELWDELAIGLAPGAIRALGASVPGAVICHVPVDSRAVMEARALRLVETPEPPTPGWIARAAAAAPSSEPAELGALLMSAAIGAEADSAEHPLARRVLARLP